MQKIALISYGNDFSLIRLLLRGELQIDAINSNFENFESALYEISEYASNRDIWTSLKTAWSIGHCKLKDSLRWGQWNTCDVSVWSEALSLLFQFTNYNNKTAQ